MSVLTSAQLVELMHSINKVTAAQSWTKPQVSSALQAIENFMQQTSTKVAISSAIESVSPGVFDANTKALLFAAWSVTFAKREGLI